jgi:hypothetical protein
MILNSVTIFSIKFDLFCSKLTNQGTEDCTCKVSVFKIRVLMRMFGSKKEKVQGWGMLHNEDLGCYTV